MKAVFNAISAWLKHGNEVKYYRNVKDNYAILHCDAYDNWKNYEWKGGIPLLDTVRWYATSVDIYDDPGLWSIHGSSSQKNTQQVCSQTLFPVTQDWFAVLTDESRIERTVIAVASSDAHRAECVKDAIDILDKIVHGQVLGAIFLRCEGSNWNPELFVGPIHAIMSLDMLDNVLSIGTLPLNMKESAKEVGFRRVPGNYWITRYLNFRDKHCKENIDNDD